jgi:hypothetical protein
LDEEPKDVVHGDTSRVCRCGRLVWVLLLEAGRGVQWVQHSISSFMAWDNTMWVLLWLLHPGCCDAHVTFRLELTRVPALT